MNPWVQPVVGGVLALVMFGWLVRKNHPWLALLASLGIVYMVVL